MSYKEPHVRCRFHAGRWVVESKLGDTWHPVALRETQGAAVQIASRVLAAMREHQDVPPRPVGDAS